MKTLSKLMIGLLAILFISTSCDKEEPENELNPEENTTVESKLPEDNNETFELITKKWDFSDNENVKSLELTNDSLYIATLSSFSAKKTSESSEYKTGKFEISNNGKTVTLIGFGKMTLNELYNNIISVNLVLDDGTDFGDLTGSGQDAYSIDEKKMLLIGKWLHEYVWEDGNIYSSFWTFTNDGKLISFYPRDENTYNYDWVLSEGGTKLIVTNDSNSGELVGDDLIIVDLNSSNFVLIWDNEMPIDFSKVNE